MITYILTFLAAWFYVTVMHEVSHIFFAYKAGAKNIKLYPFWHWAIPGTNAWQPPWRFPKDRSAWKFHFARYTCHMMWPTGRGNHIDIAPIYMDCVTAVTSLALMTVHPTFALSLAACAFIDALIWNWGYFKGDNHTDGYKFRYGRDFW